MVLGLLRSRIDIQPRAQVQRAIKSIRAQPNDLARYQFLVGIQVRVIVVVVVVIEIIFEIGLFK